MSMLIIGLLIVVAAAVFGAVEIAQNWGGPTYTIHGFGQTGHFTLAEIFIAGLVLAAIFFVGLWISAVSSRIRRRAAQQRRVEARDAKADREAAIADRDRLATALQRERAAHGSDLERDREALAQRPVETTDQRVVGAQPVAVAPVAERPVVYNADTKSYETAGAVPGSIDMTDPVQEPVAAGTGRRRHGFSR
jgi:FtsZ-interacting cell division protein ZipA